MIAQRVYSVLRHLACVPALAMLVIAGLPLHSIAAPAKPVAPMDAPQRTSSAMTVAPAMEVAVHKSAVLMLPEAASRVSVGDSAVLDVLLLTPNELYLLGRKIGTTNLIIWNKRGGGTIADVAVGIDAGGLKATLRQLMPAEKGVNVTASGDSVVLSGSVSDGYKVERAMAIAEAYAGDKKVINMLGATAPQQVLLEVKIAEISKNMLNKLGAGMSLEHLASATGVGWQLAGGFLTNSPGIAALFQPGAGTSKSFGVDAQNKDEILKVLAEPNIMAISGQEGSFLAGGKIFIPVPQGSAGAYSITLEEKEFGIGLRFTPTVLEDGRINLKVSPEVSDLSTSGVVISGTGFGNSILPSITTRRASTTVQLYDGQAFAIGGLIKNNATETVKRFPILGEIPILGALFRSSEFQHDRTELIFVVTPHLVKPLPAGYKLPTDSFTLPTQGQFFLEGKMEGQSPAAATNTPPSGEQK